MMRHNGAGFFDLVEFPYECVINIIRNPDAIILLIDFIDILASWHTHC